MCCNCCIGGPDGARGGGAGTAGCEKRAHADLLPLSNDGQECPSYHQYVFGMDLFGLNLGSVVVATIDDQMDVGIVVEASRRQWKEACIATAGYGMAIARLTGWRRGVVWV